jgi:hypothetical protein
MNHFLILSVFCGASIVVLRTQWESKPWDNYWAWMDFHNPSLGETFYADPGGRQPIPARRRVDAVWNFLAVIERFTNVEYSCPPDVWESLLNFIQTVCLPDPRNLADQPMGTSSSLSIFEANVRCPRTRNC